MTRTCPTCGFSEVSVIGEGPVIECRRFPPISAPSAGHAEIITEYDDEVVTLEEFVVHRFPVVETSDWCGEWASPRPGS